MRNTTRQAALSLTAAVKAFQNRVKLPVDDVVGR